MRETASGTRIFPAFLLCGLLIASILAGCAGASSSRVPSGSATPPRLVQGELGYEEQAVFRVLQGDSLTQVQVFWTERVEVPSAPGVSSPAALSALLVMPDSTPDTALDRALWGAWNVLAASYGSVPINVAIWTTSGTDLADLWYRANQPDIVGWTRGQVWQAPVSAGGRLPVPTLVGRTGFVTTFQSGPVADASQLAQAMVTSTRAFGTRQVNISLQYGLALLQLPAGSTNEVVYHALQAAAMQLERIRPVSARQPFTIVAIDTPPDLDAFNPAAAHLGRAVLAAASGGHTEMTIIAGDVQVKALLRANGTGL